MTLEYNCDEKKYNDIINTINGYISDSSTVNSDFEYIDDLMYSDDIMNNAEFIDSDNELENILNKSNKNLEEDNEKKDIKQKKDSDKLKKDDFSEVALDRLNNYIKGNLSNKIILYKVKPEKKDLFQHFLNNHTLY